MHAYGVLRQHYFINRTAQAVNYYQMLDTYVQSEAQQLSQIAVFQHYGALPHITRAFRSLLDEIFDLMDWKVRFNVCQAIPPSLAPTGLFRLKILEGLRVSHFCA